MLTLKPADVIIESAEDVFLRKVMALIERHLTEPDLDVQRLERELALSNTQLYRKLKALTGKGGGTNLFARCGCNGPPNNYKPATKP